MRVLIIAVATAQASAQVSPFSPPPSQPALQCVEGVEDCAYSPYPCAPYNGEYAIMKDNYAMLIIGAIVAALMCFMIGGNDSANAWGTSVGSGAIAVKHAVVIGGFGEWLGATLLGAGVSGGIRKKVGPIDTPECWACGYCDSGVAVYQVGMLGALIGASLFTFGATFLKLPVSTTHAVVGGTVGVYFVGAFGMNGPSCVDWGMDGIASLILSWFISPVLSGFLAVVIYLVTDRKVFRQPRGQQGPAALRLLPLLYSATSFIIIFMTFIKSGQTKNLLPEWQWALVALGASIVIYLGVYQFCVPYVARHVPSVIKHMAEVKDRSQPVPVTLISRHLGVTEAHAGKILELETRLKVLEDSMVTAVPTMDVASPPPSPPEELDATTLTAVSESVTQSQSGAAHKPQHSAVKRITGMFESSSHAFSMHRPHLWGTVMDAKPLPEKDVGGGYKDADALYCFKSLLVFTAFLESFAHGSNDTANATSPFTAIYEAFNNGNGACGAKETEVWIMSLAGAFVAAGVILMGYRVIETLGKDIAEVDFHFGYCCETASTLSVVFATVLDFPVSSTHCQVGAIFCMGIAISGREGCNVKLLGKIVTGWLSTIPFAGLIAALITVIARACILT